MTENNDFSPCPMKNTLKLFNRKWVLIIIWDMFSGKRHFGEFLKDKDSLSATVLSSTLKYMEKNELIEKRNIGKNNTEYYLTSKGKDLNNIMYQMVLYGINNLDYDKEVNDNSVEEMDKFFREMLNIK